jgi:GH24 family phage-related lysozyme (muramidase)
MGTLEEQLIHDEGEVLKMYQDANGDWTIGIGHNLSTRPISKAASRQIFKDDLSVAWDDLYFLLNYYGVEKGSLDPARLDALVNMSFCMGKKTLRGFRKMFNRLAKKDFSGAADEILDSNFGRKDIARANRIANQIRTGGHR